MIDAPKEHTIQGICEAAILEELETLNFVCGRYMTLKLSESAVLEDPVMLEFIPD